MESSGEPLRLIIEEQFVRVCESAELRVQSDVRWAKKRANAGRYSTNLMSEGFNRTTCRGLLPGKDGRILPEQGDDVNPLDFRRRNRLTELLQTDWPQSVTVQLAVNPLIAIKVVFLTINLTKGKREQDT